MDENLTAEDIKQRIKENLSKPAETTDFNNLKLCNNHGEKTEAVFTESKKEIDIYSLLSYHGERFIREVYKNVLCREPDPIGLNYYKNLLSEDVPKEVILYSIAASPEAKRKDVIIKGLESLKKSKWKYRLIKGFKKIPIISNLVFWFCRFIGLSRDYRELQLNINNRLDIISRTEDALYNELAKINFEIADREKAISDSLTQTRSDLSDSLTQTRNDLSDSLTQTRNDLSEKEKAINESLIQIRNDLSEKEKAINESLIQTRNDLSEKGRTVDDINNRLDIINRTEDALYNELTRINLEISEKNKQMDIKLNDILSGEFSSLKKTLKEHYNLIQDLQKILNTTLDASGFTKQKEKE